MARVVVFEDDRIWQDLFEALLKMDGHRVVARAHSLAEAHALIHRLDPKTFDVGLVDGNLSSGVASGSEGAAIAKLLTEKFSDVLVIGVSVDGDIQNVHHNVRKGSNPRVINQIIAKDAGTKSAAP